MTTLPVPEAQSVIVQTHAALGRIDAHAGDPVAELARVRRFARAERDGTLRPSAAGERLFALHRTAIRLARTDAERATAIAGLREDEPLLLALAARGAAPSVLALAAYDPALFRAHPSATTAALETQLIQTAPSRYSYGGDSWALSAFAQTLPPELYAMLYAVEVVREPGPLDAAPASRLGAFGSAALTRLLDAHLMEANLPDAERAAARLLELQPNALETRALRLAITRGEPLDVWAQRAAYHRALSALTSANDVMRSPAVSLGFALHGAPRHVVAQLVLPLLSHEDDAVRALAVEVACAKEVHAACPPLRPETDAGRIAREAQAAFQRGRTPLESSPSGCWEPFSHYIDEEAFLESSTWEDFFACAAASPDAAPPHVFAMLYRVMLPFAPRALAWLESLETSPASLSSVYTHVRLELALRMHDLDRARHIFAARRALLHIDARITWALALADSAYFEGHPEVDAPRRLELPEMPFNDASGGVRSDLQRQLEDIVATLDARGCPAESARHETPSMDLAGALVASYRTANRGEEQDDTIIRIFEAVTTHLDPPDAAYVLGRAALHLVGAGRLTDSRAHLDRIHALAPGGYVEHLVRLAVARAAEDMDTVRNEARVLIGIDPSLDALLGVHAGLGPEPVLPEQDEVDPDVGRDPFARLVCGVGAPSDAILAATGATPQAIALASDLVRAVHGRDVSYGNDGGQLAYRFELLMRGAARDDATNALRCIAGAAAIGDRAAAEYSLPASSMPGPIDDPESARTRVVVEACGRVAGTRRSPELLHAWATALRMDPSPSRAMLEAFVSATGDSESRHVLRTRIAALVRLERFVDARDTWERATRFDCIDGSRPDLLGASELRQLAPELGALSLHLLEDADAAIALVREDWPSFDTFVSPEPELVLVLIASERRQGRLDRFSSHALVGAVARADFAGMLARNPRSIVVRALALRARACGTRPRCAQIAREVNASNPASPFLALVAATHFVENDDAAEARRIVARALEANPDDRELRAFLETRCGDHEEGTSDEVDEPDAVEPAAVEDEAP